MSRRGRVLAGVMCLFTVLAAAAAGAQQAGFTLTAPANDSVVPFDVSLSWQSFPNTALYQVEVAEVPAGGGSPNWSQAISQWAGTKTSIPLLQGPDHLTAFEGKYLEWRVKACSVTNPVSPTDCTTSFSSRRLRVPLFSAVLLSPRDNASVGNKRPTLTWAGDPRAGSYRVRVNGQFVTALPAGTTSFNPSTDLPGSGTVTWWVEKCSQIGGQSVCGQPTAAASAPYVHRLVLPQAMRTR